MVGGKRPRTGGLVFRNGESPVVQVRDYFLPGMYEGYSEVWGLVFPDDGEILV